jgi:hypothetical protein
MLFVLIFLDRVVHTHEHDATLRGSFTAVEFQASLFLVIIFHKEICLKHIVLKEEVGKCKVIIFTQYLYVGAGCIPETIRSSYFKKDLRMIF